MNNWCKYNAAFGLVMDPSTGAIGIIRNCTISLCRGLEDMEHIIRGIPDIIMFEFSTSSSSIFAASCADA